MGDWGPVIVGAMSLLGTITTAVVLYRSQKSVIETELGHLCKEVAEISDELKDNVKETVKIKGKLIALETTVDSLKGSVKHVNH